MFSSSRPIIILSEIDVEDAMSSTSPVIPPVHPTPLVPPLAASNDTEAFYEDEVAPTPQISPIAPPMVTRAPTESLSHSTPVSSEPTPLLRRSKTIMGPRKRVHFVATTSRAPTPPPSSPVVPTTSPSSTSCLPLKKRARFITSVSPDTEPSYTPPPAHYHVGESSRTAAARAPTSLSLEAQLTEQQGEMIRLRHQVEETMAYRLDSRRV